MNKELVSDIFKPIGVPVVTYVDRGEGKKESQLISEIRIGGAIILLTGSSKTGKTTLYTKALERISKVKLVVNCSNIQNSEELWKKALEQIDFSRVTSQTNTLNVAGKSELKLGWKWLLSEISAGLEVSGSESESRTRILANASPSHLVPVLKKSSYQLVIEDFHYLSPKVQKIVFQEIKEFSDREVSTLVVGTTHHVVDIAFSNRDLIGRIKHIELKSWNKDDLRSIIQKGANHLSISLPVEIIEGIVNESVGLPILTQQLCLQLLNDLGYFEIFPSQVVPVKCSQEKLLETFTKVANERYSLYEQQFNMLVNYDADKSKFSFKSILLLFDSNPITFDLSFKEIVNKLCEAPRNESDSVDIEAVLNSLSKVQREIGIELLEWMNTTKKLHILEPTFMFFIRWKSKKVNIPTAEDILDELDGILNELNN